jgi:hypothetical protein
MQPIDPILERHLPNQRGVSLSVCHTEGKARRMPENHEHRIDGPQEDLVVAIVKATVSDPAVLDKLSADACEAVQKLLIAGKLSPTDVIAAVNLRGSTK